MQNTIFTVVNIKEKAKLWTMYLFLTFFSSAMLYGIHHHNSFIFVEKFIQILVHNICHIHLQHSTDL